MILHAGRRKFHDLRAEFVHVFSKIYMCDETPVERHLLILWRHNGYIIICHLVSHSQIFSGKVGE